MVAVAVGGWRPRLASMWLTLRSSPLTRRIVFVNTLPLAVLAGGVSYLGYYREALIESAFESLRERARVLSVIFAESAVTSSAAGFPVLSPRRARQLLWRFAQDGDGRTTMTRLQLFNAGGVLVADSEALYLAHGGVARRVLPPPGEGRKAAGGVLHRLGNAFAVLLPCALTRRCLETTFPVSDYDAAYAAGGLEESAAALSGGEAVSLWRRDGGVLLLSAEVAVRRYRVIAGALRLTADNASIERDLALAQREILFLFLAVLSLTVLLSLYLASSITEPLRRLAAAAGQVRSRRLSLLRVPGLSRRNDELGYLSRTLSTMTRRLQQRYHDMETFAADVAHEIKTPLTSLQSAVESVEKISDPSRRAQLMDIISRDVQRIDRLLSDISNASRLEARAARRAYESVDLAEILNAVADSCGDGEVRLRVASGGDEGFHLSGDGEQLAQALRNVVANAVSFSPRQGTVRCRLDRLADGATRITIEDEGGGIREARVERVFERFYTHRGEETDKREGHSGLGLNIARRIIRAHHGDIRAANISRNGRVCGARFTILLPAADGGGEAASWRR